LDPQAKLTRIQYAYYPGTYDSSKGLLDKIFS